MESAPVHEYIYLSTFRNLDTAFVDRSERGAHFRIYWIREKGSLYSAENNKSEIKGDWAYLIPPFRNHQFDTAGKHGMLIAFDSELLAYEAKEFSLNVFNLFTKGGDATVLFIQTENVRSMTTILGLLGEEYTHTKRNVLLLRTLLKAFLLKLMDGSEQKLISPHINEKRIHDFLLLLEKHYKLEKTVGFYARELNLSPKRLNQILKERLDKTINQLIQERILIQAKQLLFIGKDNIKEISFSLGFQDTSYFSRFFKKMTGHSPEGFRNKIKKGIRGK